MKCDRVMYSRQGGVLCPKEAKWEVEVFLGEVRHYCGVHARGWRTKEPRRVKPIPGSVQQREPKS